MPITPLIEEGLDKVKGWISENGPKIKTFISETLDKLKKWFVDTKPKVIAFFKEAKSTALDAYDWLKENTVTLWETLTDYWDRLKGSSDDLWDNFKTGLNTFKTVFTNVWDFVFPKLKEFFEYVLNNKTVLTVAFAAIGVAIFLALGPVSQAAIAIIAVTTLVGWLVRDSEDAKEKVAGNMGGDRELL